jgi:hypothetical protein
MRALRVVSLVGAVLVAGCTDGGGSASPPTTEAERVAVDIRLASALAPFDDCDALADAAATEAKDAVGPYGLLGGGRGVLLRDGDMVFAEPASGALRAGGDEAGAFEASVGAVAAGAAAGTGGAAPDYSETNVQEAGVDEPDVVKTDGRRLVVIEDRTVRVLDVAGTPVAGGSLGPPTGMSPQ